MLNYDSVKQDAVALQAMTSLSVDEFEYLLLYFRETLIACLGGVWEEDSPKGPGAPPILGSAANCLLFILFYFKLYPLQTILGFLFGLSQSRASELIHDLSGVLRLTLEKIECCPERNPEKLPEFIDGEEQDLSIDGTERRIQRPVENEKRKQNYSGKKKTHTRKNLLIVGNNDRQIKYLGGTREGKTHDKKMADDESVRFPEGVGLYEDKAFEGYEPKGVKIYRPKKKPKDGELTEEEIKENSLLSGIRIVVEHIIGSVKRLHIVTEVFRNTKEGFNDLVMEIACGLHNFRSRCRLQSY